MITVHNVKADASIHYTIRQVPARIDRSLRGPGTIIQKKGLTLGEVGIVIAKLGGYLNRKRDEPPGFESMWKGYDCFQKMVQLLQLRNASR